MDKKIEPIEEKKNYNQFNHSGTFNEALFIWKSIEELEIKVNEIIEILNNK